MVSLLVACAGLFACGADDSASEQAAAQDSEAASTGAELERLHELTVGDQTLTFAWLPGDPEDRSVDAPGNVLLNYTFREHDVLGALTREHGLLTSLEVFAAFAPAGSEPDPKLIASHPREAAAFGRADLAPKQLDAAAVVPEVPTDKDRR